MTSGLVGTTLTPPAGLLGSRMLRMFVGQLIAVIGISPSILTSYSDSYSYWSKDKSHFAMGVMGYILYSHTMSLLKCFVTLALICNLDLIYELIYVFQPYHNPSESASGTVII